MCGQPIEGMPSNVNRRKYCGKECTAKALAGNLEEKLTRYQVVDGCWLWEGGTRGGYGRIKLVGHGSLSAHRASYEHHVGPIPEGLVLDHLCRNPACINPAHLEPVTIAENIRRGEQGSAEAMKKHWVTRRKGQTDGTKRGDGAGGKQ